MEERFEVKAGTGDHFAWVRTRLSVERTLMSWVRTATGLIGFGFTIVTFFEQLKKMSELPAGVPDVNLSRYLGQALILAGVLALALSTWQYEMEVRYLWSDQFASIRGFTTARKRTPLLAVAVLLAMIGAVALIAVNVRTR